MDQWALLIDVGTFGIGPADMLIYMGIYLVTLDGHEYILGWSSIN